MHKDDKVRSVVCFQSHSHHRKEKSIKFTLWWNLKK